VRNWFAPLPSPSREREAEPPPPPPDFFPPPPSEPPGGENWLRADWQAEVSQSRTRAIRQRTGYSRQEQFQFQIETFYYVAEIWVPEENHREAWQDYLNIFVMNRDIAGEWDIDSVIVPGNRYMSPERRKFFAKWNVEPGNFNWRAWRHVMGYEERR